MPQQVSFLSILVFACACNPPPQTLETDDLITVVGKVLEKTVEPLKRATWPLPHGELRTVEIAVEAIEPLTKWECWLWAPPVLGPRARDATVYLDMTESVGFTEVVIVDVGPATAQRDDKLVTCESNLPSLFHGLRVWAIVRHPPDAP